MRLRGSCLFCRVVDGDATASVVYGDDDVVAFLDIHPATLGHTLVVPRRHASSLSELDEPQGAAMFVAAMRIQAALRRSGIRCDGVNLSLSDGESARQEVRHVHLHVMPRYVGDGVIQSWSSSSPSREELDRMAARIAEAV